MSAENCRKCTMRQIFSIKLYDYEIKYFAGIKRNQNLLGQNLHKCFTAFQASKSILGLEWKYMDWKKYKEITVANLPILVHMTW